MTTSARRCCESALKFGCNNTTQLGPNNINRNFYEKHIEIFETGVLDANGNPRGGGYWLWKPYVILQTLMRVDMNDIVIYTDAGLVFVGDVNNLLREMDQDLMVFGNGWRHGDWCKGDVLESMKAWEYVNEDQVQASCIIVKKTEFAFRFIEEWLSWCELPDFIDDTPSVIPNEPTFREHRHDQAILTNIVLREGIKYHRWPAQYKLRGNEKYKNKYGIIFNHHRLRNDQY